MVLAGNILRQEAEVFHHWLQIGRQLIEAKSLLPHGQFGAWCRSELKFSASKALKLMQGADIFGPRLESVSVTDLPSPTLIYLLAAPSCPPAIFDAFSDRVVAGEQVGSELRAVLRQYREINKSDNTSKKRLVEEQADMAQRATTSSAPQTPESAKSLDAERREARTTVISLIVERFGEDLALLLKHAAQVGSGCIFSFDAERELQAHVTAEVAPFPGNGSAAPEPRPMSPDVSLEASALVPAPEVENMGNVAETITETAATAPHPGASPIGSGGLPPPVAVIRAGVQITHSRMRQKSLPASAKPGPALARHPSGPRRF